MLRAWETWTELSTLLRMKSLMSTDVTAGTLFRCTMPVWQVRCD